MFERLIKKPLESRKSFFLFGPRGTGKTTWLRHRLPDALFVNLLQSEYYNRLSANPGHLRQLIPPDHTGWTVIDEVQRIPALLNEVHDLIEARGLVFVLTGSSARTLRRRGVNLLAGRALTYRMHPLTAVEQQESFNLRDSVQLGHLPARFSESDPAKYLKDYVQTYLREEVMQESLTRNIAHFAHFLEVASFSQGATINISAVAREAHIERSVAENYFSILEDLLIAVRLPVFSRKAKRKLISQKKFFFFDAGVFRAIRPVGPLDSDAEIDGPALETLVFQELRAVNDYLRLRLPDLFLAYPKQPGSRFRSVRAAWPAGHRDQALDPDPTQGHKGTPGIQERLSPSQMFRPLRWTESCLHGRRHRSARRARLEESSPHPG